MDIRKNIEIVKYKVAESAEKAGKKPEEIRIVAVGKTFPAEILLEAKEGGLREFGENKVQELVEKMNALGKEVSWHMIGHLQKNKAKYIVGAVDLIHSLDSFDLALQIDKTAEKCGCIQDVLVQVNISGEETKFGLRPEIVSICCRIIKLKGIPIFLIQRAISHTRCVVCPLKLLILEFFYPC
jgi:pyridoxal phosphate enzyme (YggS family)